MEYDGEEGIDAGGLSKDWFLELSRRVFGKSSGLFRAVNEGDSASSACDINPGFVLAQQRRRSVSPARRASSSAHHASSPAHAVAAAVGGEETPPVGVRSEAFHWYRFVGRFLGERSLT